MNKRIFSLVCIALYALLDASIYCSQQKESDARNKSVRGTKEINRSNEKKDIKFKQETQLKNKNTKNDGTKENLYSKVPSNLSSDEMIEIFLNDHKDLPTDKLEFTEYILNIFKNDPEQTAFLFKLYSKLSKQELSDDDYYYMMSNFNGRMKNASDLSSDEMIKIFKDNHKDLPTNKLKFTEYILNIFENDPEQTAFLFKLYSKLSKNELYDDYYYMMSNFSGRMKNALWLSIKFQFLMHDTLDE
ncbi:fam-c protein [Plasmodium vinckei brucechwatti]|uniref:Fam-c protein n=1 Tax=Plasmodium vinckei brucechwatti TaxID=119398 RepID=A0A6V7SCT2_PLAVN|nr:fam-c protein [Plasmodium vinckei brucechwatti]